MIHIRSHQVKVKDTGYMWGYKTLCNKKVDYAPTKPCGSHRADEHCVRCLKVLRDKKTKEVELIEDFISAAELEKGET